MPYSMMFASFALLIPSLRGSAKPTLMLWLPFLSIFTADNPSAPSNSPVERDSYFVPLPTTEERLLCALARTISPPASSTFCATGSKSEPSLEIRSRKSSGILISTLATGRHRLFRKHLHIHPTPFDIFHGRNFKASVLTDQNVVSGNLKTGNDTEAEQVGCLGECSKVCPTLTPVAAFPVNTDRCEDFIHRSRETLAVLYLFCDNDISKTVHFSKTHITPSNLGRA
ncbi:hypothetical protein CM240_0621 [Clostridium bornimense]|uniref:Uncharacterized protein n=1 Tax=Clostridium bornimense TaxID=1216932 RepID=W6RT30_9CLOT|nr:hypothetical protein CM240_0621 [Clostridium bornimense]